MPIKYTQPEVDEWPISIPKYEPTKYWYSGLEYHELPELAREFLSDLIPYANSNEQQVESFIKYKRRQLATGLASSLQGNDEAFIRLRHQARRSYIALSSGDAEIQRGSAGKKGRKKVPVERILEERGRDGQRIRDVLEVLIPRRKQTLDDFMTRFDALIWWELKCVENLMSEAEQERHRNASCKPIIIGTHKALRTLDRRAMDLKGDLLEDEGDVVMADDRSAGSSTEDDDSSSGSSDDESASDRRLLELKLKSSAATRASMPGGTRPMVKRAFGK